MGFALGKHILHKDKTSQQGTCEQQVTNQNDSKITDAQPAAEAVN